MITSRCDAVVLPSSLLGNFDDLNVSSSQVTHFTVDMMHCGDGGILKQAVRWIFGVGLEKALHRVFPLYKKSFLSAVNAQMDAWHANIPVEYSRRPNHLEDVNSWKMRETNVTATLIIPALLHVEHLKGTFQAHAMKNYMRLVGAIRLVGGFAIKKISRVSFLYKTQLECFLLQCNVL